MGIPEMRKRGYPAGVAVGSIAAGGTLGILIPPSVTMIVYGIATETSIGRLFLAGVIPGLLLVGLCMAWSLYPDLEVGQCGVVEFPRVHLERAVRDSGAGIAVFGNYSGCALCDVWRYCDTV